MKGVLGLATTSFVVCIATAVLAALPTYEAAAPEFNATFKYERTVTHGFNKAGEMGIVSVAFSVSKLTINGHDIALTGPSKSESIPIAQFEEMEHSPHKEFLVDTKDYGKMKMVIKTTSKVDYSLNLYLTAEQKVKLRARLKL